MTSSRANVVLSICTVLTIAIVLVVNITLAQNNNDSNAIIVKEQKLPKEAKQAPLKTVSHSFGKDKSELKGFSVEVKNISDRPIYYARYALIVSSEKATGIFFPVFYNEELQEVENGKGFVVKREALEPAATATLRVLDKDALVLAKYLRENNLGSIKKIELVLQVAYYNETDHWIIGQEDKEQQNKQDKQEQRIEINKSSPSGQVEASCGTCSGSCGNYTSSLCFPQSYCAETIVNRAYTRTGRGFARPTLYVYLCEGQNNTVVSYVLCQLTSCSTQN